MKFPLEKDYPKQLHIRDATYKVRFVKKISGESSTFGECCPVKQEIKIKKGLTLTETFNTFIHETLHAIEFEYDIDIPHSHVYVLEKALSDLLVTNF